MLLTDVDVNILYHPLAALKCFVAYIKLTLMKEGRFSTGVNFDFAQRITLKIVPEFWIPSITSLSLVPLAKVEFNCKSIISIRYIFFYNRVTAVCRIFDDVKHRGNLAVHLN